MVGRGGEFRLWSTEALGGGTSDITRPPIRESAEPDGEIGFNKSPWNIPAHRFKKIYYIINPNKQAIEDTGIDKGWPEGYSNFPRP